MATTDIATRAQALGLRIYGASDEDIHQMTGIEASIVDHLLRRAVERGLNPQSQHPIIRDRHLKGPQGRRTRCIGTSHQDTGGSVAPLFSSEILNSTQLTVTSAAEDNALCAEKLGQDAQRSEDQEVFPPELSSLEGLMPPLAVSRYRHTLCLLSPLFPSLQEGTKSTLIINTADVLLRDDMPDFLLHQLPLWEGPWRASPLPDMSAATSLTDRLVMIDQSIDCLERHASTDGLALHFHSVVQYQLYSQLEREVTAAQMTKSKGVGNASITLNLFLPKLYPDDWGTIEAKEKKIRQNKFHHRKSAGKRLQTLCDYLGYGVLLLGSRSAMRNILKRFDGEMIEPFLCYLCNAYPEIPGLCRKLDVVARCILEGRLINSLTTELQESVEDVEQFLLIKNNRSLPSTFRKVELRELCQKPLRFFGFASPPSP